MHEWAEELLAPKIQRLVSESEARGISIGEARGISIGEARGIFETLFGLVRDGILSVKAAAERANVSEADFVRRMASAGNI